MVEISGTGETSSSAKKPLIWKQQGHVEDVHQVFGEKEEQRHSILNFIYTQCTRNNIF